MSLSLMDRSSRHKINKEIVDLNYTIHQMYPADFYRTFYTMRAKTHNLFQWKWYIVREIEITSGLFLDHIGKKLEINNMKIG